MYEGKIKELSDDSILCTALGGDRRSLICVCNIFKIKKTKYCTIIRHKYKYYKLIIFFYFLNELKVLHHQNVLRQLTFFNCYKKSILSILQLKTSLSGITYKVYRRKNRLFDNCKNHI